MSYKISNSKLITLISPEAKKIFEIFDDNVRLVGGCVRDMIINRKPNDEDFATLLMPEQVEKILNDHHIKSLRIAIKYGTICAIINNKKIEITTLRVDSNHRGRQCDIDFTKQYHLDAIRRDFSINSLYMDRNGVIYDYCNAINDIKNKKIKFIGNSQKRIEEDYLRILRFFRFGCQLGFKLDLDGLFYCIKFKDKLNIISNQRKSSELFKMTKFVNKNNFLKILKIIDHFDLSIPIFNCTIDIKSLENLFKNGIKNINSQLIFVILFSKKAKKIFFNFDNFNVIFSNNQKKYIYNVIKLYNKFESIELKNYINSNELVDLIIINSIDYNKEIIIDALLLFIAKQDLIINNVDIIIFKINKFIIPNFPLNGKDLIESDLSFNIKNNLLIAKKYWYESKFNLSKDQLINYIKTKNCN